MGESGAVPRTCAHGGQETACVSWFFPSTVGSEDPTQVIGLTPKDSLALGFLSPELSLFVIS